MSEDGDGTAVADSEVVDSEVANSEDRGDGEPVLSPAVKSSLLWGVVGGLAFLVLIQGYELVAAERVSIAVKFGVALLVAVLSAWSTHVFRGRVPTGS